MLKKGCIGCKIIGILAIIGALNWGLVGIFGFNLVEEIFGMGTGITRVIYGLVGLSGLFLLMSLFKCCPCNNKTQ